MVFPFSSFKNLSTDPKSILNSNYRYQLLVTLTIQIFTLSHGIATGWTAPTVHKLQLPNSPTDFVLTVEQTSWVGSLYGLGALCGNILYGVLINRIGRKWCMSLMAVPHMIGWILKLLSYSYFYLYIARFLIGISGGANYVVTSIFICEIADCKIRGALSTIAMVFLSFGILFGYIMSTHLNYYLMPCIVMVLPMLYTILITRFPETPQHLLRKKKIDDARKSFNFYKSLPAVKESVENQTPIEENPEFLELKKDMEKSFGETDKLGIKDFVNSKALLAFCTAFVIIILNEFSGSYPFLSYASDIFFYSGSNLDPNTCTIVLGVAQIIGCSCTTFMVDRFGRKFLMLLSTAGLAICLAIFGFYTQFTDDDTKLQFNWIPLAIMTMATVASCCGIISLAFTLIVEVMPARIRGIGTSICMATLSAMIFVALKIFPIFLQFYGLSILMYSCCGVCIVCFIYLSIFQRETNGESMNK